MKSYQALFMEKLVIGLLHFLSCTIPLGVLATPRAQGGHRSDT
jgi:hypothetical protein